MKDSLGYLVMRLLHSNKIFIDKKELQFQIESHPSYPSLHAITGVFDHFNIDNLALDIPKNEETLAQLPKTFLAQIETNEGKEFVVALNKGINYQLISSSKNRNTVSIKEFLKQFTGIIVVVEKTQYIDESKNSSQIYNQILITLTSVILLSLIFITKPNFISSLFFITSILGLVISFAMKKQEQGQQTVLGNAFCSGESERKDCNAVLSSNGAALLGNYKLSDLSIIYFLGLSLTIFSLTLLQHTLTTSFIISFLAVPITIYSIYYQAIVIKKWCSLCLSIVGVLWVQATLSIIQFNILNLSSILWTPLAVSLSSFLLTLTTYNLVLPKLTELSDLNKIKIDFFKFKRNFKVFSTLLEKTKYHNTIIQNDISEIVLGNPESKLKIIIITNPFCGYCKPLHTIIEDILRKYSNIVNITIRIASKTEDKENELLKIATHLLGLYHKKGQELCLKAMHDIYNNLAPEKWLEKWEFSHINGDYLNIIKMQSNWCIDNNLNFTPEILINGKSFPKEYDRSDLVLFIEDLHESCSINTTNLQLTT
ncbi:hypothetical protein FBALC1_13762 [Flavobacteriales bacterium ALC-1]|nr:hypothetical protein FBALC1_13762 [Flavobacteriales bacterium ALC-1]